MMEVLAMISPYIPMVLFGIFGLCVVLGMLYGLGRGFKRSWIRLLLVTVFLVAAFFLTPFTINMFYGLKIKIAGHTPAGWVAVLAERIQENADNAGYLTPLMPYLQDYMLAIASAIINIVLFLALYFFAKWLSWIIYAIIARCCAPKKDKEGNKIKKHAWAGLFVGLVQGIVLFFFLMVPVNGLIGVVDKAAGYKALGETHDDVAATASVNDGQNTDDEPGVLQVVNQLDKALGSYQMFLKYSYLQSLSDQAFAYQTMVRINNKTNLNLSEDLVTALQFAADLDALQKRLTKQNEFGYSEHLTLSEMSHADYAAVKYVVEKAFKFNLLRVLDLMLADLDKILAARTTDDGAVLAGTENWAGGKIYDDSFYGYLIENYANPDDAENFVAGVRAMVGYLATSKLDFVKKDLLQVVDFLEDLYTIKVAVPKQDTTRPLALAFNGLQPVDCLDLLLTTIPSENYPTALAEKYDDADYTPLDIIFKNILDLQVFQMLTRENAENFVLSSNFFTDTGLEDQFPGVEQFLRKFAGAFLGQNAIGTQENKGPWLRLCDLAKSALRVGKNYLTFVDDLQAIMDEITAEAEAKGEEVNADQLMPQAILRYLSNLLDKDETENKYARLDELVDVLHQVTFAFESVTDFVRQQVTAMKVPDGMQSFGDFKEMFLALLDKDATLQAWQDLFHSVVDFADLLTQNEVITEIMSVDFSDPEATKEIFTKIVGTSDKDALLKPDEVAQIIYNVLEIPNIGEKVNEIIAEFDFGVEIEIDLNDLKNMPEDELIEKISDVWQELRNKLASTESDN